MRKAHCVRIQRLVEQSAANTMRPRLSDDIEAQLRDLDVRSAACYAELEDLSSQFNEVADQLDIEACAVPVEIEPEDSVVNHIEDVKESIRQRQSDPDVKHIVSVK